MHMYIRAREAACKVLELAAKVTVGPKAALCSVMYECQVVLSCRGCRVYSYFVMSVLNYIVAQSNSTHICTIYSMNPIACINLHELKVTFATSQPVHACMVSHSAEACMYGDSIYRDCMHWLHVVDDQ